MLASDEADEEAFEQFALICYLVPCDDKLMAAVMQSSG